jgi:DNA primase
LLYGLYQARRAIAEHDEVVVVEGYTDVLGLVQAGVTNVVASMGTALTEAQVGLMTRFTANLTFMFDADRAGTEAMLRSGELARQHGLRPMMAVLPKDSDPADVAREGGVDGVAKVVAGKMSLLGFELRQALDRSDTSTSEGRVRAFEAVRVLMAKASSLKEREEEIAFVADRLRLTPESAALLLREQATPVSRNRAAGRAGSEVTLGRGSRAPSRGRLFSREASIERDFLVAAGCNPEHALTLLETLTPEHFTDSSNREVFEGLLDAFKLMKESADQAAVLAKLRAQAHGDSEAGRLFVRLMLEADQERYSTAVLDELHLRLQEAYFMRAIIRQRALLEEESDVEVHQRRLLQLERLLQSVRIGLKNLDPEEGQG